MKKKSNPMEAMLQKRIQMTISIVLITLSGIILFGGTGYLLDHYFDTNPIFLFVLLVLSFPITQIILYKRAKQLTKDMKK